MFQRTFVTLTLIRDKVADGDLIGVVSVGCWPIVKPPLGTFKISQSVSVKKRRSNWERNVKVSTVAGGQQHPLEKNLKISIKNGGKAAYLMECTTEVDSCVKQFHVPLEKLDTELGDLSCQKREEGHKERNKARGGLKSGREDGDSVLSYPIR